jgi:hypothetical protein
MRGIEASGMAIEAEAEPKTIPEARIAVRMITSASVGQRA